MLEVERLVIRYDSMVAVREACLKLERREIVAILGSNGAGKSTLLNAIAGLVDPWSGKIFLNGEDVTHDNAYRMVRRGVLLVPEGRHVVGNMNVEENLLLGSVDRTQAKEIDRVYDFFPALKERRKQAAGLLSGGEQQMLAIGRALMAQPKLLIVDEPTLGLAPQIAQKVLRSLAELAKQDVTILLVEQNVRQALKIADRAYYMEKGKVQNAAKGEENEQNSLLRYGRFD